MNSTKDSLFSNHEDIKKLLEIAYELNDIEKIGAVLGWDQETYMPKGGITGRANQLSTLAGIHHEKLTSDRLINAIDRASMTLGEANVYDRSLVRELRRIYDQAVKLPVEFVKRQTEVFSRADQSWQEAKEKSDFRLFADDLKEIVELVRKQAEYFGFTDSPYDALLDIYEPGLTSRKAAEIFKQVKVITGNILEKIEKSEVTINQDFLKRTGLSKKKQWDFGIDILKVMEFDFERGRQDESAHPFSTNFHPHDVRVTTRFTDPFFTSSLFGTIHEGGHGIYEQNVDERLARTVLCEGASLGIHESQSRFWENYVGRSLSFWALCYPELRKTFKRRLKNVSVNDFWRAINAVNPSYTRVEADEVTYNLHVLLRFEIEKDLIEGKIEVEDLPEIWNAKMKEYLGIVPPNDELGVLQDIHWSGGAFGYFPTYTMGNLYAAQMYYTIREKIPGMDAYIAEGNVKFITEFLIKNIYRYGKTFMPDEIILRLTGESLNPEYFEKYLEEKYSKVYKW